MRETDRQTDRRTDGEREIYLNSESNQLYKFSLKTNNIYIKWFSRICTIDNR